MSLKSSSTKYTDLPNASTLSVNGWFPVFVALFVEDCDRSRLGVESMVAEEVFERSLDIVCVSF